MVLISLIWVNVNGLFLTFLGDHTGAVQKGLNLGVILFIVSEALFFLAIFWAFFHRNALWIGTKLRVHPKALITKLLIEMSIVASSMIEGIVTSLKILVLIPGMGYRGSKSDSHISVKEQRADGSSIYFKYRKVCSTNQRNLVFIHRLTGITRARIGVNTIAGAVRNKSLNSIIYQTSLYSTKDREFYSTTCVLDPNYITGFTDGEGCFTVSISSNSRYKTGYKIKVTFQIGLHINDITLLEQIKLFFGVGYITKLGAESVQFRVSSLKDLNIIIDHFDKYPLLTRKQSDFLLFKEIVNLIKQGKHLSLEGLNKIVSIKAILNSGKLPEALSLVFADSDVASTALAKTSVQDLHWLAGFTEAEGCFFIASKKSLGGVPPKLGETVWLKFIISQHSNDKNLLVSLISIFNCGRYISKPGKDCGEFIVEKFTDVRDKVIPLFEKFKLHGLKSKNFEDFNKAAMLINNKAHLTRDGLDEIKKIKGRMNKARKASINTVM